MYIKNQTFSDAETLEEALFDFELGTAARALKLRQQQVLDAITADTAYQQLRAAQQDAEDREALDDEERFRRLTEVLMQEYGRFEIRSRKLYGLRDGEPELLAEIDLV